MEFNLAKEEPWKRSEKEAKQAGLRWNGVQWNSFKPFCWLDCAHFFYLFFFFWTLFFLPRTLCIIAGGIVGWFYFLRFLPSDKKVLFFCDVFWSIVLELAFRNGDAGCEKSQNKRTKQISARSMPWSSFSFFLTSTFAVLCIFLEVLLCEKSKNKYLFLTAYFTCVSHQAG